MPFRIAPFLGLICSVSIACTACYSQNCEVDKAELKGSYMGDCRKGKANGNGAASGFDRYEGQFKAGFPEGEGTYHYHDGNLFIGSFIHGMREGHGKMIYKRPGTSDSIVQGFWRKDEYIGLKESAFLRTNRKTSAMNRVSFSPANYYAGNPIRHNDGCEWKRMIWNGRKAMSGIPLSGKPDIKQIPRG